MGQFNFKYHCQALKVKALFKWLLSLIMILFLWGTFFQWDYAKEISNFAKENDIDTGTFFYSDTIQFYNAQRYMQEFIKVDVIHSELLLIFISIIGLLLFLLILWFGFKLAE